MSENTQRPELCPHGNRDHSACHRCHVDADIAHLERLAEDQQRAYRFTEALRRIAAMDHDPDCVIARLKTGRCVCHVAVAKEALGE